MWKCTYISGALKPLCQRFAQDSPIHTRACININSRICIHTRGERYAQRVVGVLVQTLATGFPRQNKKSSRITVRSKISGARVIQRHRRKYHVSPPWSMEYIWNGIWTMYEWSWCWTWSRIPTSVGKFHVRHIFLVSNLSAPKFVRTFLLHRIYTCLYIYTDIPPCKYVHMHYSRSVGSLDFISARQKKRFLRRKKMEKRDCWKISGPSRCRANVRYRPCARVDIVEQFQKQPFFLQFCRVILGISYYYRAVQYSLSE